MGKFPSTVTAKENKVNHKLEVFYISVNINHSRKQDIADTTKSFNRKFPRNETYVRTLISAFR